MKNLKKVSRESAIKQSLEIVRKRIDESGTKEPLIQRSGKNRILTCNYLELKILRG